MKSRVGMFFPCLALAAALGAALTGCTITGDRPKPEPKPPEVKKPEVKKPEAKKPEAKKPEAKKPEVKKPEVKKPATEKPKPKPVPPRADLTPREAAREWWQAVLNEDRQLADLYVISPESNEFLIQYVRELKKNARTDVESQKELESMRRAAFDRIERADGFVIVPATKDGEHFFKVFFQKHHGRWLIYTIN